MSHLPPTRHHGSLDRSRPQTVCLHCSDENTVLCDKYNGTVERKDIKKCWQTLAAVIGNDSSARDLVTRFRPKTRQDEISVVALWNVIHTIRLLHVLMTFHCYSVQKDIFREEDTSLYKMLVYNCVRVQITAGILIRWYNYIWIYIYM